MAALDSSHAIESENLVRKAKVVSTRLEKPAENLGRDWTSKVETTPKNWRISAIFGYRPSDYGSEG